MGNARQVDPVIHEMNLASSLALLELYACRPECLSNALEVAEVLLQMDDESAGMAPGEASDQAPAEVTAAIYTLVGLHGLEAVQKTQKKLGNAHPAMLRAFEEITECEVSGYDR